MIKGLYKDLIVSEDDLRGVVMALKEGGAIVALHEYGKVLKPLCDSLKVPLTRAKEYPKPCNYLIVYGVDLDLLRLVTLNNVDYIIVIRKYKKDRKFKNMLRNAFNDIFANSEHLHHLLKIPIYESGDDRSLTIFKSYDYTNIIYRRSWNRFSNLKIYKGAIKHIRYYLRIPTMQEWRQTEVKSIFTKRLPKELKREVQEKIDFINDIKYPLHKLDRNFINNKVNDIHSTVLMYLALGTYDKNYHFMMMRNYYHFEEKRGSYDDCLYLWNYFASSGLYMLMLANKNIEKKWLDYLEVGNPYTYIEAKGLTTREFFNGVLLKDKD